MLKIDFTNALAKADELLKTYRVSSPPIRIEDIIAGEGLQVFEVDFQTNNDLISGFIDHEKSTIYLNKYEPDDRQAFTLAHELGHWLLHRDELKTDSSIAIMYRKTDPARNENPREKEANCFAANLLVPKNMLDKKIDILSLPELAALFRVSQQVITYRLQFEYGNSF